MKKLFIIVFASVSAFVGVAFANGNGLLWNVQNTDGADKFSITTTTITAYIPLKDANGNAFVTSTSAGCDTCLAKASNLSDLASTSSARSNLGFTGSSPIVISSTGTIVMAQSSAVANGWLSSVDWSTFNGKLSTSTGLTINNFATTSVSQWANNSGYITTSTYNLAAQTCSGTNKVSAVSATGTITCTADEAGEGVGGTATSTASAGHVWRSVTMTNIGTSYKDIYSGTAFDEEHLFKIDFSNVTATRMVYLWDYVGTGSQQVRLADLDDNNNVLIEAAAISADQDPGDTGWVALPAAFQNSTKRLEWQGKSTTAADDPVAKGYILYLKFIQ